MADDIAEVMENITLSIDLSNPDTQRYGVDLGKQATTVIGVENTDGNYVFCTVITSLICTVQGVCNKG